MIRRHALFRRAIPLLALLVLGCAHRPTPALTPPTPTAPPLLAPAATSISTSTPIPAAQPQIVAANLRFDGWSPGSIWIAYWASPREHAPQALNFFNVTTGQRCPHPEIQLSGPGFWESDYSFLTIHTLGTSRITPCGTATDAIPPSDISTFNPAVSPNGQYRVDTDCGPGSSGVLMTLEATGEVIASYPCAGGVPGSLGGQWITDDTFLINEIEDRFPTILQSDGTAINIATDLFHLPPASAVMVNKVTTQIYYYAQAFRIAGTDEYHLLFYSWLDGSDYWTVLLYHSETGATEALPIYSLYTNAIPSPDDRSFILSGVLDTTSNRTASQDWFRFFDPPGSPMKYLPGVTYDRDWSPDSNFMALAIADESALYQHDFAILDLATVRVTALWHTGDYLARPAAWSPDGRYVVALGTAPDRYDALYLFAR
jgi:hypothetical protein